MGIVFIFALPARKGHLSPALDFTHWVTVTVPTGLAVPTGFDGVFAPAGLAIPAGFDGACLPACLLFVTNASGDGGRGGRRRLGHGYVGITKTVKIFQKSKTQWVTVKH